MKRQTGFTIVEVLVASAVGLIALLAVTQYLVNVQKQVRSISADLAITQFVADLVKTLKKGDNCNEAMKGQVIDDSKPVGMMGNAQFNLSTVGKFIKDANSYDAILTVTDVSLELQSTSPTSNARDYNVYLMIEKKRELTLGPAMTKKKLGLLTLNVVAGVVADPLACLGFDGAQISPLTFGELPTLPYSGDACPGAGLCGPRPRTAMMASGGSCEESQRGQVSFKKRQTAESYGQGVTTEGIYWCLCGQSTLGGGIQCSWIGMQALPSDFGS